MRRPNFAKQKQNEGLPRPKRKDQSTQSLPNQRKSETLVKGVPTEFTNYEFKEILDYNRIQYVNTERMKSRRDGRLLHMFPAKPTQLSLITSHAHIQGYF